MDFYIDIGAAVLLRLLKDPRGAQKYKALFLKIFRAIALAFVADNDFVVALTKVNHDVTGARRQ